ncbi:threonine/homoserine efflux transporter RhtA [Shimia isoporae]|uniref:Threonine/homoserine efflux transporter RhtA n=1 Tax=Shimia isoporae TaxID=647720 RepID=A0A4R1NJL2_9RHOB|nr:DMT family transporter [Shimia isoporae]TCL08457.1 threonine/homoserine efflux transporter RhtA [Shimia isoporae]
MWKLPALMFLAMSLIPAGDAAGKLMTQDHDLSPIFVGWSRFALGTLLALPLVRADTLPLLTNWRIWLRALLLVGGITSIQTALLHAPLADVFAAFFIGPIFSFALSALLLGERVTLPRAAMMALGFAGVLLVVRPDFGGDGPILSTGRSFAVLAGLFYGAFLTASRWLATAARPGNLLFTQLFLGAIALTPFGLAVLPEMTVPIAGLTFASAAFSGLGNLLLIYAYMRADASELAPYVYFQLASAVALGWLIFADVPDALTWSGLALIAAAGLASARLAAR